MMKLLSKLPKIVAAQKVVFFSRRIECRRETTTNVRTGFTLDLGTFYSDNTNAHDIRVAIGITDSEGNLVYRQLPGKTTKANRRITTPNYIDYSNPTNLAVGTEHEETFDATIGEAYTAEATQAVTESCRLRYCYTYLNANRDLESAPSKLTEEIAVSRNDPVEISGFVLPDDPQVTDIRLYRICPDLGETAMTLIETLPLNHTDGSVLPEITTTDELTRADLGDLTYNEERQLVFRQIVREATTTTPAETRDVVIVEADGTRANVSGFDEQYNSYINATGRVLDSWDNLPPPPNGNDESLLGHIKFLQVVRGTLVGIIGSRIHWSRTGFPDYWPAQNFLEFNEEVTGILEVGGVLLVFTQNETHAVANFPDPRTISRTLIDDEQGCVNIRAPKFIRNYPVWVSNDGICTFNNNRVDVISRNLLGDDFLQSFGDIITTEVHNDQYFILYANKIVVMDNRFTAQQNYGVVTTTNFKTFDTNGVRWIEKFKGEDILYGTTDTNTVVEMFAGDEDLSMTYRSGEITLIGEARIKRFEKLYVAYAQTKTGIALKTILRGLSSKLQENTYQTPINKAAIETKVPNAAYHSIQFEITGFGEVQSIDFTAIPSEQPPSG